MSPTKVESQNSLRKFKQSNSFSSPTPIHDIDDRSEKKGIKTRGGNTNDESFEKEEVNFKEPVNLILIWGCKPTKGVKANTKMCEDLSKLFNERYDRLDLKLEIPKVFD